MKKTSLFILLASILLISNLKPQTYNIYIGTDTLSSNYPFTTYWMDGRTDMLYLASELAAGGGVPGYFTGISFYVNHVDTLAMNGFNIKMLNTTDTSLSAFSEGWQVCYSGTYKIQDVGWQSISFNQSFGWNGEDNVLVEICYNNSRWTWFSTVRSSVKQYKTYGKYDDLTSGDGCVDLLTGGLQSRRPNICFHLVPITGINNTGSIPEKYSLSQNYPNPFNPVTRINYSIPKSDLVSLKVYDNLGRLVSVLVNEHKNAGSYIVEFNASNLSSGLYYYRLTSGEFTDIKKMMVVK
jgi:hypothetical protein